MQESTDEDIFNKIHSVEALLVLIDKSTAKLKIEY